MSFVLQVALWTLIWLALAGVGVLAWLLVSEEHAKEAERLANELSRWPQRSKTWPTGSF